MPPVISDPLSSSGTLKPPRRALPFADSSRLIATFFEEEGVEEEAGEEEEDEAAAPPSSSPSFLSVDTKVLCRAVIRFAFARCGRKEESSNLC